MAGSAIIRCPRAVHAVVLPDKSMFPEPVIFYREDQAAALAAAVEGAEHFQVTLHMAVDGNRAVRRLREECNREPAKFVYLQISREGAESYVSSSAGWGAIGEQEITEALLAALGREA